MRCSRSTGADVSDRATLDAALGGLEARLGSVDAPRLPRPGGSRRGGVALRAAPPTPAPRANAIPVGELDGGIARPVTEARVTVRHLADDPFVAVVAAGRRAARVADLAGEPWILNTGGGPPAGLRALTGGCTRLARPMDAAAFRAHFPVLESLAYLNAGTDGPIAKVAAETATAELAAQATEGRVYSHFERRRALLTDLRAAYAAVLGCDVAELALTTSTSEGIGGVLGGLGLGAGDEIVTSDSEHPGLIGPLLVARSRGVTVKAVPLRDVADAIGATTTLVACSHVNWLTGELAPAALADAPVPVVLDGAQGVGAIPIDVKALGCAAYAGSGQKWLCGADGTGMLYVAPEFLERVSPTRPGYTAFEDPSLGLESTFSAEARKLDAVSLPREGAALSLSALELLTATGFDDIHARAATLAAQLADRLAESGRTVAPRDATTLVAWEDADPEATRERLAAAGVGVRNLPGTPYLRASVGAWNDESDLDRLLSALG